jgi:hypothetical protein
MNRQQLRSFTVEIDYERDGTLLDLINGGGTCGTFVAGSVLSHLRGPR